jgi:NAD-dependent SIR2 family protein deacetylase
MTDLFNYCTRCGDELEDDRAQAAAETKLPPICDVCARVVMYGLPRPVAALYGERNRAREAGDAIVDLSSRLAGLGAAAVRGALRSRRDSETDS